MSLVTFFDNVSKFEPSFDFRFSLGGSSLKNVTFKDDAMMGEPYVSQEHTPPIGCCLH